MTPLGKELLQRVVRQGPITVAQYMAAALMDPRYGYYCRLEPFGRSGDFTTAPEISQMFGELLGAWAIDAWERLGAPNPLRLIELGPGRGSLMVDLLRTAKLVPSFDRAIDLHLVEASPRLQRIQSDRLGERVTAWHRDLGEVPEGPAIILANEFVDALPIRQFLRQEAGWCERLVTAREDGRGLAFGLGPVSPLASTLIPIGLRTLPAGQLVEVSTAGLRLATDIGNRLVRGGGVALVIDFGPGESTPGASLQALKDHQPCDPLTSPGEADLAAHVDFASFAVAAREAGASTFGPLPQGQFLSRLGIEQRAAALLRPASEQQAHDIITARDRLIGSEQMGSLFKVLAITEPGFAAPFGLDQAALA